ncbi:MAG: thiolase family protein [Acholeplasmataceae bacterium]
MEKIYVVAAKRSAIGSFLGSLKDISIDDLGKQVLNGLFKSAKIDPKLVDEVIIGNVLGANLGLGWFRKITIESGLKLETPSYSVNMVCGSGMQAIINGYNSILTGKRDLVLTGGIELMSNAPHYLSNSRSGNKLGDQIIVDSILKDGLTDPFLNLSMGLLTETLVSKYNITKEEQDLFSYHSQLKAIKAKNSGKFKNEIIPIKINRKKEEINFSEDEFIRENTSLEKIKNLKPVFKKDGTITAGSSSGINDGASFILLASERAVQKYNLKPLALIKGIGSSGVNPELMGLGPIDAIKESLKEAKLSFNDIDLIEINESFAAQVLAVVKELSKIYNLSEQEILKLINPNGGAIALGHPIGASGNRIVVTLVNELLKNNHQKYGLATLCIGSGMGLSLIIEKV